MRKEIIFFRSKLPFLFSTLRTLGYFRKNYFAFSLKMMYIDGKRGYYAD